MFNDMLIERNLDARGRQFDAVLVSKMNNVLQKPRHLDGPPAKYSPVKLGAGEVEPFGVYADYRRLYAVVYAEADPKDGVVVIQEERVSCTYRMLCTLKALTYCGITKSSERAHACRELFSVIVGCRVEGALTEQMMMSVLTNTGDFYKNEITRAVVDSVYTDEEQMEWFLRKQMRNNYDAQARSLFKAEDVVGLEEEIDDVYRAACKDASFKVEKHKGRAYNAVRYLRREIT